MDKWSVIENMFILIFVGVMVVVTGWWAWALLVLFLNSQKKK